MLNSELLKAIELNYSAIIKLLEGGKKAAVLDIETEWTMPIKNIWPQRPAKLEFKVCEEHNPNGSVLPGTRTTLVGPFCCQIEP